MSLESRGLRQLSPYPLVAMLPRTRDVRCSGQRTYAATERFNQIADYYEARREAYGLAVMQTFYRGTHIFTRELWWR